VSIDIGTYLQIHPGEVRAEEHERQSAFQEAEDAGAHGEQEKQAGDVLEERQRSIGTGEQTNAISQMPNYVVAVLLSGTSSAREEMPQRWR
jgi:hypothetical protein